MDDFSDFSDEELERIANGGEAQQPARQNQDFSDFSDEELERIAAQEQPQVPVQDSSSEDPSADADGSSDYGFFDRQRDQMAAQRGNRALDGGLGAAEAVTEGVAPFQRGIQEGISREQTENKGAFLDGTAWNDAIERHGEGEDESLRGYKAKEIGAVETGVRQFGHELSAQAANMPFFIGEAVKGVRGLARRAYNNRATDVLIDYARDAGFSDEDIEKAKEFSQGDPRKMHDFFRDAAETELRQDSRVKAAAQQRLSENEEGLGSKIVGGALGMLPMIEEFAMTGGLGKALGILSKSAKAGTWGERLVEGLKHSAWMTPVMGSEMARKRYGELTADEYGEDENGNLVKMEGDTAGRALAKAIPGGLGEAAIFSLPIGEAAFGWATPMITKALRTKVGNTVANMYSNYVKYGQMTGLRGQPQMLALMDLNAFKDEVMGLGMKDSEYKGFDAEWKKFTEGEDLPDGTHVPGILSLEGQADMFVSALGVMLLQAGAAGKNAWMESRRRNATYKDRLKGAFNMPEEVVDKMHPELRKMLARVANRLYSGEDALGGGTSRAVRIEANKGKNSHDLLRNEDGSRAQKEPYKDFKTRLERWFELAGQRIGIDGKKAFDEAGKYALKFDNSYGWEPLEAQAGKEGPQSKFKVPFTIGGERREDGSIAARRVVPWESAEVPIGNGRTIKGDMFTDPDSDISVMRFMQTDPKGGDNGYVYLVQDGEGRRATRFGFKDALDAANAMSRLTQRIVGQRTAKEASFNALRDATPALQKTKYVLAKSGAEFDNVLSQVEGKRVTTSNGTRGVTLPDGRVMLCLDRIETPQQMKDTLFHEVGRHRGIDLALPNPADKMGFLAGLARNGDRRIQNQLNTIVEARKARGEKIFGKPIESAEDLFRTDKDGNYDPNAANALEELYAHLFDRGDVPEEPGWWDEHIVKVRQNLRKVFHGLSRNYAEAEAMYRGAMKKLAADTGVGEILHAPEMPTERDMMVRRERERQEAHEIGRELFNGGEARRRAENENLGNEVQAAADERRNAERAEGVRGAFAAEGLKMGLGRERADAERRAGRAEKGPHERAEDERRRGIERQGEIDAQKAEMEDYEEAERQRIERERKEEQDAQDEAELQRLIDAEERETDMAKREEYQQRRREITERRARARAEEKEAAEAEAVRAAQEREKRAQEREVQRKAGYEASEAQARLDRKNAVKQALREDDAKKAEEYDRAEEERKRREAEEEAAGLPRITVEEAPRDKGRTAPQNDVLRVNYGAEDGRGGHQIVARKVTDGDGKVIGWDVNAVEKDGTETLIASTAKPKKDGEAAIRAVRRQIHEHFGLPYGKAQKDAMDAERRRIDESETRKEIKDEARDGADEEPAKPEQERRDELPPEGEESLPADEGPADAEGEEVVVVHHANEGREGDLKQAGDDALDALFDDGFGEPPAEAPVAEGREDGATGRTERAESAEGGKSASGGESTDEAMSFLRNLPPDFKFFDTKDELMDDTRRDGNQRLINLIGNLYDQKKVRGFNGFAKMVKDANPALWAEQKERLPALWNYAAELSDGKIPRVGDYEARDAIRSADEGRNVRDISGINALQAALQDIDVEMYPAAQLDRSDARVPNTKLAADPKSGIVPGHELKGRPRSLLSKPILGVEFEDGTVSVGTGRHRAELYSRYGMDIPMRRVREADGWVTKRPDGSYDFTKVRLLDALDNIQDSKGTIEDYVAFFRDVQIPRAEAESEGFLSSKEARTAYALANDAIDDVRNSANFEGGRRAGYISPEQAGAIADAAPKGAWEHNETVQRQLLKDVLKDRTMDPTDIAVDAGLIADDIRREIAKGKEFQMDLFGNVMDAGAELREKKRDYIRDQIAQYERLAKDIRAAKNSSNGLAIKREDMRRLGINERNVNKDEKTRRAEYEKAAQKAALRAMEWRTGITSQLKPEDRAQMERDLGIEPEKPAAQDVFEKTKPNEAQRKTIDRLTKSDGKIEPIIDTSKVDNVMLLDTGTISFIRHDRDGGFRVDNVRKDGGHSESIYLRDGQQVMPNGNPDGRNHFPELIEDGIMTKEYADRLRNSAPNTVSELKSFVASKLAEARESGRVKSEREINELEKFVNEQFAENPGEWSETDVRNFAKDFTDDLNGQMVKDDGNTFRYFDVAEELTPEKNKEYAEWLGKYRLADGPDRRREWARQNPDKATPEALAKAAFEARQYEPAKYKIPGAVKSRTLLEEPPALRATEPPDNDYKLHIPDSIIKKGDLQEHQAEFVGYAGKAHETVRPDGTRLGMMGGYGTGAGKSRMIAGIILDNRNQGRKRALWITTQAGLVGDVRSESKPFGMDGMVYEMFGDKGVNVPKDGIGFGTYHGLRQEGVVEEIAKQLGKDFDGVIAFDEIHRAKTEGGNTQNAVVKLQELLPKARVVYMSATGATDVGNLGYGQRLGLWGEGTAFKDFEDFKKKVENKGVSAMEMVAQTLKRRGQYLSANLSKEGVEFDHVAVPTTDAQKRTYAEYNGALKDVYNGVYDALEAMGRLDYTVPPSSLHGMQQRLHYSMVTALKVPVLIERAKQELAKGNVPVFSLVNTNEAGATREIAKALERGEQLEMDDVNFGPKQILLDFLTKEGDKSYNGKKNAYKDYQFPTMKPVKDQSGEVIGFERDQIADGIRRRLVSEVEKLPDDFGNPINMIIDAFGKDKVANLTGLNRGGMAEDYKAFQDGDKKVLVFSGVANTGYTFSSDRKYKNQARRVAFPLQLGYRADELEQTLGRVHRNNQANAPIYVASTTDLPGERRFYSSVERRRGQMKALTTGDRSASGNGITSEGDNFETKYAQQAVDAIISRLHAIGKLDAVAREMNFIKRTQRQDGSVVEVNGMLKKDKSGAVLPNVPAKRFLNRLLMLDPKRQDGMFTAFKNYLDQMVQWAKDDGEYDIGMQDIGSTRNDAVRSVKLADDMDVEHVNSWFKTDKKTFDDFAKEHAAEFLTYVRNKRTGETFAVRADGKMGRKQEAAAMRYAVDGTKRRMRASILDTEKPNAAYEKLDSARAKELWDAEYGVIPDERADDGFYARGDLLRHWADVLGSKPPRMFRIKAGDAPEYIGARIAPDEIPSIFGRFGKAEEARDMVIDGKVREVLNNRTVDLVNGWSLKQVPRDGAKVVMVRGVDKAQLESVAKELGGEVSKKRIFIQPDAAKIREIIEKHPANLYRDDEKIGDTGNLRFFDRNEEAGDREQEREEMRRRLMEGTRDIPVGDRRRFPGIFGDEAKVDRAKAAYDALPKVYELPSKADLTDAEADAAFKRHVGSIMERDRALAEWSASAPDVLPFVDADNGAVSLVSKDTKEPGRWRVSSFVNNDGGMMITGHSTFDTKAEAVKDATSFGREYDPSVRFFDEAEEARPDRDKEYRDWLAKYRLADNERNRREWDARHPADDLYSVSENGQRSRVGRNTQYGVGKDMMGKVYFHKNYAEDVVPKGLLEQAKAIAEERGFDYNTMMYDPKSRVVRLDESPDFDTAREPHPGRQLRINPDGTAKELPYQRQIFHHKWAWVKDDYDGFDVQESKDWSRRWLSANEGKGSPSGWMEKWNEKLDELGLPRDGAEPPREKQTALSGDTSLNQNPSGNRYAQTHGLFKPGTRNIDIGAGKFDKATQFLREQGVENIPYDPVNRDAETNRRAAESVRENPADTATVHNVLNVIDNDAVMEGIVNQAARAIKKDGTAIFTIYEGDRSGNGRVTTKGYQRNTKASAYVPVLEKYFGEVETHGNVITARQPKDVGPAFWAEDSSFDRGLRFFDTRDELSPREEMERERRGIGGIYTGTAADYANRVPVLDKDGKQTGWRIENGPSLKKIGTGEGSQVYGWGLYGSTVKDIALGYAMSDATAKFGDRRKLLLNGKEIDFRDWDRDVKEGDDSSYKSIANILASRGGDNSRAIVDLEMLAKNNWISKESLDWFKKNQGSISVAGNTGNLYEQTFFTDRAPGDESHLLMWYSDVRPRNLLKNIRNNLSSEQADAFKRAYDKAYRSGPGGRAQAVFNGDVYKILSDILGSQKSASEFLRDKCDIDGVKYPVDSYRGPIRNGDEVGWNYVSFRDDNIQVDHKWVDGQMRYFNIDEEAARRVHAKGQDEARRMEGAGAGRREIWEKTGWWKGKDGKWRFEIKGISDADTKKMLDFALASGKFYDAKRANVYTFTLNDLEKAMKASGERLPDSVKTLLAAYPKLGTEKIEVDRMAEQPKDGVLGYATSGKKGGTIHLYEQGTTAETLNHELQHRIQEMSGMAGGTNTNGKSFGRYTQEHGEWEARQAATRAEMTDEERAKTAPWETADRHGVEEDMTQIDESNRARIRPDGEPEEPEPADPAMERKTGIFEKAKTAVADRYDPIKQMVIAAGKRDSKAIHNGGDPYDAMRLLHGHNEAARKRYEDIWKRPFEDMLRKSGVTVDDVGMYMISMNAKDRNRKILDRTGALDGAGLSDADADKIRSDLRARLGDAKMGKIEEMADFLWKMQKEGMERRVESGRISREMADQWAQEEPHHVPMRDDLSDEDGEYNRSTRQWRKSDFAKAEGRRDMADNPVEFMFKEYQDAVYGANINEARRALADFVRTTPGIGTVRKGVRRGKAWSFTHRQIEDFPDPNYREQTVKGGPGRPNLVSFKEGGNLYMIELNGKQGERVAEAVIGRGVVNMWKPVAAFTRGYASTATELSPTFLGRNFVADMIEASLNTMADKGIIKGGASAVKNVVNALRMTRTIRKYITTGRFEGEFADTMRRYVESGASIGGMGNEGYTELKNDLGKVSSGKRGVSDVLKFMGRAISNFNKQAELATRLAVFKDYIDGGASDGEAAMRSREYSTDFNKYGNQRWMNSAWMFSGSVIGGAVRQTASLVQGKSGKQLMLGLFAYGVLEGMMEHFYNADEDEKGKKSGQPSGATMTEYNRANSLYFRMGDRFIRAPFHAGPFSVLKYAGNLAARAALGDISGADAAKHIAKEAFDSGMHFTGTGDFNSDTPVQSLLPTLLVPFYQLKGNEDYAGRPIRRQMYSETKPYSENGRKQTGDVWKSVARGMNELTGGNERRRGWFDFSPENYKFVVDSALKNLGRDITTVSDFVTDLREGKDVDRSHVLFGRDYVRSVPDNTQNFYEAERRYKVDRADGTIRQGSKRDEAVKKLLKEITTLRHWEDGEEKVGGRWVKKRNPSEAVKEKHKKLRLRYQQRVIDLMKK